MKKWFFLAFLANGCSWTRRAGTDAILLTRGQSVALLTNLFAVHKDQRDLPLVFLPRAGCLGVAVMIEDRSYIAIVDTGSPFLTTPPDFVSVTTDASTLYPSTPEQYGEAFGEIQWRRADDVDLGLAMRARELIVGVVAESLVEASGGLYLGLLYADDNRPTFLNQCQLDSFSIDYEDRKLRLFKGGDIFSNTTPAWPMFDLTQFGPNVYHYGVLCDSLSFQIESPQRERRSVRLTDTKRPIVVVIDTGLTGCILSDSFSEEIGDLPLESITGASIELEPDGTALESDPKYWYLSSFCLPWFPDDSDHPHILAAGATFLNGSRLVVDARRRLMQLQPKAT